MSMILRLQREKSEAMMEARQYRRYTEERFTHDAVQQAALHDVLERREDVVWSLSVRLRACQARLLHLGFLSPSQASLPSSPTVAAHRGLLQDHHHHPTPSPTQRTTTTTPFRRGRPGVHGGRGARRAYYGARGLLPEGDEELGFHAGVGGWVEEEEIQKLKARWRMSAATVVDDKALTHYLNEISRALLQADVHFETVHTIQSNIKTAASLDARPGHRQAPRHAAGGRRRALPDAGPGEAAVSPGQRQAQCGHVCRPAELWEDHCLHQVCGSPLAQGV
ncbi:hypothetical protein BAE44_0026290 [Dichanthelium oligosanthes]|uniref:GTD-binding domain-containing protein n=1 Tax=Dichanthelium oligosanthes TaxID=888268 RepID=A0A1E5UIJ5_9POAL|nr:hypothetical protein BAE44_0026290 [Dichanthelium oligosanthes]